MLRECVVAGPACRYRAGVIVTVEAGEDSADY